MAKKKRSKKHKYRTENGVRYRVLKAGGITTASGKCRFGKAKQGKRKGECLLHKRAKR